MNIKKLKEYGFDSYFLNQFEADKNNGFPARVTGQLGNVYKLQTGNSEVIGKVMGKFIYNVKMNKDYPVVGDFVIAKSVEGTEQAEIIKVLERKNVFSRKMPISGGRKLHDGLIDGGLTEEQILASNVDFSLIFTSVGKDFNISKLERYIMLAKRSKLQIVLVITKIDLDTEHLKYVKFAKEIDEEMDIVCVSSVTGEGIEGIKKYLKPEHTIALFGPSGVGKSTLLNAVFGEEMQKTGEISMMSGKGKHTTTSREMFFHSSGCMIIDTPGVKELQLWADEEDLEYIFPDIVKLSGECKYNNCRHSGEAGCAINNKIESGDLSLERFNRYKKMLKEIKRLSERQNEYAMKLNKRGARR